MDLHMINSILKISMTSNQQKYFSNEQEAENYITCTLHRLTYLYAKMPPAFRVSSKNPDPLLFLKPKFHKLITDILFFMKDSHTFIYLPGKPMPAIRLSSLLFQHWVPRLPMEITPTDLERNNFRQSQITQMRAMTIIELARLVPLMLKHRGEEPELEETLLNIISEVTPQTK